MTLRQKQSIFARLVADLIIEAERLGYAVTFGEAYRSPEEAARLAKTGAGIARSLHTQRLAIDLNLFKDGVYLTKSEAYRPLGLYWESRSSEVYRCAWGGRFIPKADGNHFSLAHEGRQ